MSFLLEGAPLWRGAVFLAVLSACMIWEARAPARARILPRARRWTANLGLGALNSILLRLCFPILAVGAALHAQQAELGLFNRLDWPVWLEWALALILLDLMIYGQHVLLHRVPLLWRLHAAHHADPEVDASTALRFHPAEIMPSMGLKIAAAYLIGPAAGAMLVFEILLNGMAVFNHTNARLPAAAERILRLALVTPDMHRVHHSTAGEQTNRNFGFVLSCWDRLFATYHPAPAEGVQAPLGLKAARGSQTASPLWLASLPFLPNRRFWKSAGF